MVLVSHPLRFVFCKTFKTASTSVEMALERFCAPEGHVPEHACPVKITDVGIIGARMRYLTTNPTPWWAHMSAEAMRKNLGEAMWSAYDKIAVLRNPFDKAVSWFFWNRKTQTTDPVTDFRAFLKRQEEKAYFKAPRDLDWRTTHIDGQPIITRWLKHETIGADLDALCNRWGVDRPPLRRMKHRKRARADRLPVAAYFDEPTADILRRHQAWMFELGGYSDNPADAHVASREVVV